MIWTRHLRPFVRRAAFLMGVIGPGLITASAGNDAPGIATYSMAGSFYGYGMLWVLIWAAVGAIVLLEMAARMGAATGQGLTSLVRTHFGAKVTVLMMIGLALANLGTTAAQFAGVAASAELFGLSRYVAVPLAGLAVWLLVLRGSYERVEKILLLLTLYSLAYVGTAFLIRPQWGTVLRQAVVPSIQPGRDYLLAALATIGTTVTPWACAYMQAFIADKGVSTLEYPYTRLDVVLGLIVSSAVAAFIVIAAADTLHASGIHVETAAQAAMALQPLAGPQARLLFGVGLFGASMLAASVLPLSTTYAVCGAFGWERGIDHKAEDAPAFYGLYTLLIASSAAVVLVPDIPIFTLMWLSQVLNAVLLPFVVILMLKLANDRQIMTEWKNSRLTNVLAAVLVVLISVATISLIAGAFL